MDDQNLDDLGKEIQDNFKNYLKYGFTYSVDVLNKSFDSPDKKINDFLHLLNEKKSLNNEHRNDQIYIIDSDDEIELNEIQKQQAIHFQGNISENIVPNNQMIESKNSPCFNNYIGSDKNNSANKDNNFNQLSSDQQNTSEKNKSSSTIDIQNKNNNDGTPKPVVLNFLSDSDSYEDSVVHSYNFLSSDDDDDAILAEILNNNNNSNNSYNNSQSNIQALLDLHKQADEITKEINECLKMSNIVDKVLDLRIKRRKIWEKIENLESAIETLKAPVCLSDQPYNTSSLDDEIQSQAFEDFSEEKYPVDPSLLQEMNQINKSVFHHDSFRGCQAQAIEAALKGEDVFILMPTGGGKSLCYQLAGYMDKKLTIVISPLISLIEDQFKKLSKMGIKAASYVHQNQHQIFRQINQKELLFLFITPEKLEFNTDLFNILLSANAENYISRFVVDEAHCVSEWGLGFRPSYKQLKILREKFSKVPIMALTGSANHEAKIDIMQILNINNCKKFQMSFNRPNLIYEVQEKGCYNDSITKITTFLHEHNLENKTGIIFCLSKKDTEDVSKALNQQGFQTRYYHSKLKKADRLTLQLHWTEGKVKIMVATVAFGMGIDKPDVRFVIHHSLPKSIDLYYQETGRAGRDGLISYCLLLFSRKDIKRNYNLIYKPSFPSTKERSSIEADLFFKMENYCSEKIICRRVMLLQYFGEQFSQEDCDSKCDNCQRRQEGSTKIVPVNITQMCIDLANIINDISEKRPDKKPYPTDSYVSQVYFGSKSKAIINSNDSFLSGYRKGKKYKYQRCLVSHAFKHLIENKIIETKKKFLLEGTNSYYVPGKNYLYYKRDVPMPTCITTTIESNEDLTEEESHLFDILQKQRSIISNATLEPIKTIISDWALKKIAKIRPKELSDFHKIPYIKKKTIDNYGTQFIDCIKKFEKQNASPKLHQIPNNNTKQTIGTSIHPVNIANRENSLNTSAHPTIITSSPKSITQTTPSNYRNQYTSNTMIQTNQNEHNLYSNSGDHDTSSNSTTIQNNYNLYSNPMNVNTSFNPTTTTNQSSPLHHLSYINHNISNPPSPTSTIFQKLKASFSKQ